MREPIGSFTVTSRFMTQDGVCFVMFNDHGVERQAQAIRPMDRGERFYLNEDGRAAPVGHAAAIDR